MTAVSSIMLDLGTAAPDFSLPDTTGKQVSLADFKDAPAVLVVFMCNHCPYVKHLSRALAEFAREYQKKGLAVVGINSNDVSTHRITSYNVCYTKLLRSLLKMLTYSKVCCAFASAIALFLSVIYYF